MKFFKKKTDRSTPPELPGGSFTFDARGELIVGTVRSEWLLEHAPAIIRMLQRAFHSAEEHGWPLNELVLDYAGLRLTARNVRGGGLVFLAPTRK